MSETTLVLVSGGFDPLHSGHIAFFKAAKELGTLGVFTKFYSMEDNTTKIIDDLCPTDLTLTLSVTML